MDKLNQLELSILERLERKYFFLKSHIPCIMVKNRELTGVGMYVNFIYTNTANLDNIDKAYIPLSTNEIIKMVGLKNGLQYEVNYENGRLLFLELVTCDEEWDGLIRDFSWDGKF